ncbi:UNVERIFIED_CONTAM: hypothetical protein Sradi_7088700 [Sesamum radiatum]|uniref:Uncharacterized protein n=1 Tax=Sesamum radiatum TaxID=300843 RepID=A0AAW2J2A1_SESRA
MAETAAASSSVNNASVSKSLQLHGLDPPGTILISAYLEGTADVGGYFTKLRKIWDELDVLMPTPQCTCNGCTCGASKAVAYLAVLIQLLQFLMGLNDEYDHVCNQVLVMDRSNS